MHVWVVGCILGGCVGISYGTPLSLGVGFAAGAWIG
jgi:hypothetical protein